VSVAIKKLDGVESVEVSLEKATADIRLKSGNTITLPQLRRLIRQAGYPTKDAHVEARGTFVERSGKPTLDLQNGSFLELAIKPSTLPAGVVDVSGVSRVVDKEREVLTITDAAGPARPELVTSALSLHQAHAGSHCAWPNDEAD